MSTKSLHLYDKSSTRKKESLPQKFKETFAAFTNSALFVLTCTASISTLRPFRERLLPWPLANHLGPFNLNLNLLQKPIPNSIGSKTGVPQSNRLNRTAKLCLYPFPPTNPKHAPTSNSNSHWLHFRSRFVHLPSHPPLELLICLVLSFVF